jgi:hypothetical protein
MKSIVKYILVFFLFLCIETNAQEAGTNSAIPSKTTVKGRRELRKDKRIKRHEKSAEKANAESFETKADKPFHKKRNRKALNKQKDAEEIRKKG